MELTPKPLPVDPGQIAGLSSNLIRSHYQNNYLGALSRLNTIRRALENGDRANTPGFALVGAKREELLAANSVFLHEAYFDALGGDGSLPAGGLSVAIERDFGSFENWLAEFTSLAKAMGGGSGWAILAWSAREARLLNHWAGDHTQLLAGASMLLALDMYEHAYHMDFGAKASAYVDAFMTQIHWEVVASAYACAIGAASAGLGIHPREAASESRAVMLDVRRRPVFELAHEQIPGSDWRDPALASTWQHELEEARPVVVYCAKGHEVSQGLALTLRANGVGAQFLIGGIEAWREAGLPLAGKAQGAFP
ncbi:Fe-Mn family superoxide dismutase [Achromobacter xylosoxidans]|uniref:Fe-Mn family superoxide dismutase n=1 Tax=Alcaligenes xylosoxydans xylosoxydans TaxID=85698 RepID=UPI000B48E93E|nr:Fe-Mn family superoxide dismutase [Achromobacter xylosoxidans]